MHHSFSHFPRFMQSAGTSYNVGFQVGKHLGPALADYIDAYLLAGPYKRETFDYGRHQQESLSILHHFPQRYQQELEGIAHGAKIPLKKIARWVSVEACMAPLCSGFLLNINHRLWLGRNNDLWSPHFWGYARERHVNNRIPVVTFGLAGDVFTATGINKAGLWLHYNYLKAPDMDRKDSSFFPNYCQIVEMLETCETWKDISVFLSKTPRQEGMMLFVSDRQNNTHGIFECTCWDWIERPLDLESPSSFLIGTNHYTQTPYENAKDPDRKDSVRRYQRLETLLTPFLAGEKTPHIDALKAILADKGVEKSETQYGTVYAAIYSPHHHVLWYTFGGYPAASCGNWQTLLPF